MNYTKTGSFILVAIFCSLFQSDSHSAEESYKRFTVRNWTYRDGTEAKGKLISVSGPNATLRLEGKGTVRVPLEKLSIKDLNWIYEYHKRKKQLSFLPLKYRKLQVESAEPKPASPKSEKSKSGPSQPETGEPAENVKEESYKAFTVREWISQDGRKYKAKFMSLSLGNVTLLQEPGGFVKVSLDQLSKKDLDWVIEYHRRNNLLMLLPAELRSGKSTAKLSTNTPDNKKGLADRMTEHTAKIAALREKHKKEMALKDPNYDPNVIKANTEIDPALVTALTGYRVWSDKKGKKSEARFIRINGREVTFSLRPVGIVSIPIGRLIDEDLQLLRDALKMHGRFDEMPLVYREPLDSNLSPTKLKQLIRVNNHRKWTDLSGNSMGASYVKMEDGKIFLINTKTSAQQEFPYLNFSSEDQVYVQERLKKEIPGQFFPEEADSTLTPEEKEKEFRVWIDRSNRKIKGKFVRLAYGNSVAVINTGKKEELFITEFFSDQDLSLLKPKKQKNTNELAMNNSNNNFNVGGIPGAMNRGMGGTSVPQPRNRAKEIAEEMMRESARNNTIAPHNDNLARRRSPGAFSGFQDTESRVQNRVPGIVFEIECKNCNTRFDSKGLDSAVCPNCGVTGKDNLYQCTRCDLKFSANKQDKKPRCPHCKTSWGNTNIWTAIIRLIVVIIILCSGGYYKYGR